MDGLGKSQATLTSLCASAHDDPAGADDDVTNGAAASASAKYLIILNLQSVRVGVE